MTSIELFFTKLEDNKYIITPLNKIEKTVTFLWTVQFLNKYFDINNVMPDWFVDQCICVQSSTHADEIVDIINKLP